MKKIYKDRLLKLANHLKKGKLGHDKFNFNVIHEIKDCGSMGCALGELPYVFPKQIKLPKNFDFDFPLLSYKNKKMNFPEEVAFEFFNLTMAEVEHLFYPCFQNIHAFGEKFLRENATKTQVANNILAFIKNKEK